MQRVLSLIFFSFLLTGHITAQSVNLSDSLQKVFKNKPVPSFKLDFRNSLISGKSAQIGGVKAGLAFGNTMGIGVGYSWLYSKHEQRIMRNGVDQNARIKIRTFGPYMEYSFFRKGNWESSVTAQVGLGKIFLDPDGKEGAEQIFPTRVFVYEPTIGFEYKIGGLVGVGLGYGYRLVLRNNRDIEQNFTAPVYVIRFRLILDSAMAKWKEIRERENAHY